MRSPPPLLFAAVIALVAAHDLSAQCPRMTHVRSLSPTSQKVLEEACGRSQTVRGLVEALESTDVVVYVGLTVLADTRIRGRLGFLSQAGGLRYLLVEIDNWRACPPGRIATLGHELQHALEIADAPEVCDHQSFVSLYRRIGWEASPGKYETARARAIGWLVHDELMRRAAVVSAIPDR